MSDAAVSSGVEGWVVPITNLQLKDNSPDHFPGALVDWANRLNPSRYDQHNFHEAFKAIDSALLETASYLEVRETAPNKEKEHKLAQLWMTASRAVSPIDSNFADAMAYKGLGWANSYYWSVAENNGYKIEVTDVQIARALLTKKRQNLEDKRMLSRPPPAPRAPAHIKAGNPVLIVTLIFSGIFGLGCIYGGIQLMAAPGAGETVFNFFGVAVLDKASWRGRYRLGSRYNNSDLS
jgi:hypothetical protein